MFCATSTAHHVLLLNTFEYIIIKFKTITSLLVDKKCIVRKAWREDHFKLAAIDQRTIFTDFKFHQKSGMFGCVSFTRDLTKCVYLALVQCFLSEKSARETAELELLKDFQSCCLFIYWQMNWQLGKNRKS